MLKLSNHHFEVILTKYCQWSILNLRDVRIPSKGLKSPQLPREPCQTSNQVINYPFNLVESSELEFDLTNPKQDFGQTSKLKNSPETYSITLGSISLIAASHKQLTNAVRRVKQLKKKRITHNRLEGRDMNIGLVAYSMHRFLPFFCVLRSNKNRLTYNTLVRDIRYKIKKN